MKRTLLLLALTTCVLGLHAGVARPSLATWTDDNCRGDGYSDSNVKRSEAQSYAAVAFGEGYEWGGGCWNDNYTSDRVSA